MRSNQGSAAYWARWTAWDEQAIRDDLALLAQPLGDPSYEPQFRFNLARRHWEAMLRRYSAGAPVPSLRPLFGGLLEAWEGSVRCAPAVLTPEQIRTRNAWVGNLDHYVVCFWLTGLALALDLPEQDWRRLVALMGNEGEDALLDRVIATRASGRRIGTSLCHPQPYARLLAAVDAATPQARAAGLADFVAHWYAGLDRPAAKGRAALYNRPYWHRFGDENFDGGAYFGRWCVEAAAAARAFGIDDTLCRAHPHYPGALLRADDDGAAPDAAAAAADTSAACTPSAPAPPPASRSLLRRLLGR
jgi:hypothetical protein